MLALAAAACALLAAGCGDRSPMGEERGVTQEQIERLSSPTPPTPAEAQVQLEPLGIDDIQSEALIGAGCTLMLGDAILLAAVSGRAAARVDGRLVRLAHEGPLGESGGFFRGQGLSVSVGRAAGPGSAVEEGRSWPVRATVTRRADNLSHAFEALWVCGA
jgi:hypothetical protein